MAMIRRELIGENKVWPMIMMRSRGEEGVAHDHDEEGTDGRRRCAP